MNPENAVEVHGVTKTFTINGKKGSFLSASRGNLEKFTALNGITIDIPRGEVLGIIGRNGSGKSTLLSIIAGIMPPDSGTVEVSGKVASILELGMGFHPDLSGRENIRIKGALYGFRNSEISEMMDDIIDYSELGDKIDDPVRTYSTGMSGRLAFSIMSHVKADIMLVDEVLSTGDAAFAKKTAAYFTNMAKSGITIIFVSHSLGQIQEMCKSVAWIDKGIIREIGAPNIVIGHYQEEILQSFDILEVLAESGDPTAQNTLGCKYRDGVEGLDQDYDKAIELFRQAAASGNDKAQVNLGDMLFEGIACEVDKEGALELYRKAAIRGNNDAKVKMGVLYTSEQNTKKNQAKTALKILADKGDLRSTRELADLLIRTAWNYADRTEALSWYEKAASMGDPTSMFISGTMYRDGTGTPRDMAKAMRWMNLAADAGEPRAMQYLGDVFYDGIKVKRDPVESLRRYNQAVDIGYANAYFRAALMNSEGDGTNINEDKASKIFTKISNRSMSATDNYLGWIYRFGVGYEPNPDEAIKWYRYSAENDDRNGLVNLGNIQRDGMGSTLNYAESIRCFLSVATMGDPNCCDAVIHMGALGLASKDDVAEAMKQLNMMQLQGNVRAMVILGNIAYDGISVERDEESALKWFLKASANGDIGARLRAGDMYRDGIGVEQNLDAALQLYKSAAKSGNPNAMNNFIRLILTMGPGHDTEIIGAIEMLKRLALGGNSEAAWNIVKLSSAMPEFINSEEVLKQYSLLTINGDPNATLAAGRMYRDGVDVTFDEEKAKSLLFKAAKSGNWGACSEFISFLQDSNNHDCQMALTILSNIANGGNVGAANALGNLYYNGNGVCLDRNEAFSWFSKAAKLGDSGALLRIGDMYRDGIGVDQDLEMAISYYSDAVKSNNISAMERQVRLCTIVGNHDSETDMAISKLRSYAAVGNGGALWSIVRLGSVAPSKISSSEVQSANECLASMGDLNAALNVARAYRDGNGVERNIAHATELMRFAARGGHIDACKELVALTNGLDCPDGNMAYVRLKTLALGGNVGAMDTLGNIYFDGKFVKKNLDEASKWYSKSANLGSGWGKRRLTEINNIIPKVDNAK